MMMKTKTLAIVLVIALSLIGAVAAYVVWQGVAVASKLHVQPPDVYRMIQGYVECTVKTGQPFHVWWDWQGNQVQSSGTYGNLYYSEFCLKFQSDGLYKVTFAPITVQGFEKLYMRITGYDVTQQKFVMNSTLDLVTGQWDGNNYCMLDYRGRGLSPELKAEFIVRPEIWGIPSQAGEVEFEISATVTKEAE